MLPTTQVLSSETSVHFLNGEGSGCTASDTALTCPGSSKPPPPPKPTSPSGPTDGGQSNSGSSSPGNSGANSGNNNAGGSPGPANNGVNTGGNKPATQAQSPTATKPGNSASTSIINNPLTIANNGPTVGQPGPTTTPSDTPISSADSNNSTSQTANYLIYIGIAAGCVIIIGTISVLVVGKRSRSREKTLLASSISSEKKGKDLEKSYYSSNFSSRTTSAFASERGTLSGPSEDENQFRVFHFSTDSKLQSMTGNVLQEQFNNVQTAGLSNISISPSTNIWKGHYEKVYLLANENGSRLFLDLVKFFLFPVNLKFSAAFDLLEDEYLVLEEKDEIMIKQHLYNGTFEAVNITSNESGLLPLSCLPYPRYAPKLILVHLPEFEHESVPILEAVEYAKQVYPDKVEIRSIRNYMSIEGGKIHDAGIFDSVLDNSKIVLCGTTVMVQYMHEKLIDFSSEFWTYMDSSVVTEEYDIFSDQYEDYAPYDQDF
ncbi:hypothetical protein HDV04_004215 [Boothiomyces sp. JEL0838]|nr:hypothetical protein HDV04_004215 [Boothiomyces sp. JEL0838]